MSKMLPQTATGYLRLADFVVYKLAISLKQSVVFAIEFLFDSISTLKFS